MADDQTVYKVPYHPDYVSANPRWLKMTHTLGGSDTVKAQGEVYLPKTEGQKKNPNGSTSYENYKTRANFYDWPKEIAVATGGLLTQKEPTIELPTTINGMEKIASATGQSLSEFTSDIQTAQAEYGRAGILADIPDIENPESPLLYLYSHASIINWVPQVINGVIRFTRVLLDESGYRVDEKMNWEVKSSYRILALDASGRYYTASDLTAKQVVEWNFDEPDEIGAVYPAYKGKEMTEIPFVIANVTATGPEIERPPLENIADLAISLYRGDADYRQALFMQAQATPYFRGFSKAEIEQFMFGAGGSVFSERSATETECGFMEVAGSGLPELRQAVENYHAMITARGIAFIEGKQKESGAALAQRAPSKTASMSNIARVTDDAFTTILNLCAVWTGSADTVIFETNKDFAATQTTIDDLLKLMAAYNQGLQVTQKDIHGVAKRAGVAKESYEITVATNLVDRGVSVNTEDENNNA